MIRLTSLNKYFNKNCSNEIHVINNVNLELPDKGMVAIFGMSGCGKTTLLNVIGGLDSFQSGSVEIDGQNVTQSADYLRNKYIGYIFQNYNLNKAESNFENVADALRLCGITDSEVIENRVNAALKNVGMDKFGKRTPDTLSGGQMQRIAIARAIVKNPKIILADEPTGNLDEANTLLIMNLLKQISKDHLVLLVTHEANLVDYYCDRVIEISDGSVVSERVNESAEGLAKRNKNDIYLGELQKTPIHNDTVSVDYYGDAPENPLKISIVNHGGKMYLSLDDPKIQILDQTSEVKLREGVFEEKATAIQNASEIDMSSLPPLDTTGNKFGKLFGFAGSVKSGYLSNFKKGKKGKGVLRACMFLFSLVIVFMTASLGTSIKQIKDVQKTYDKNVFYVYIGDSENAKKLGNAIGNYGIDTITLLTQRPYPAEAFYFSPGNFETFEGYSGFGSSEMKAYTLRLGINNAKDMPLVAGKKEITKDTDIVITTSVADQIIENSTVGYIKDYDDLIGLCETGSKFIVAGIVRSDENAIFSTNKKFADDIYGNIFVADDGDYPFFDVEKGHTVLVINYQNPEFQFPNAGDTLKFNGNDLILDKVVITSSDYYSWCENQGYTVKNTDTYITDLLKADGITVESPEYNTKFDEYYDEHYFDALSDHYSHLDEFISFLYSFGNLNGEEGFYSWLYSEKGIDNAKYYFASEELYNADLYKAKNGTYPTNSEYWNDSTERKSLDEVLKELNNRYQEEYWSIQKYKDYKSDYYFYILDSEDYITGANTVGEMYDGFISPWINYTETYGDEYYTGYLPFAMIHTTDDKATNNFIKENFSSIPDPYSNVKALYTPEGFFDEAIEVNRADIISNLIEMIVFIAIMSVCMYFIMRSSLMSRIKEVGIYRAIGVSKRNLRFKFAVEALVLTTLTVFIGFIISSALMFLWTSGTTLIAEVFYYPVWLALIVLAVLYAICIICGCLPISALLRKTPSEILAKYDI